MNLMQSLVVLDDALSYSSLPRQNLKGQEKWDILDLTEFQKCLIKVDLLPCKH